MSKGLYTKQVLRNDRCLVCGKVLLWQLKGGAIAAYCECGHSYAAPTPEARNMLIVWVEESGGDE